VNRIGNLIEEEKYQKRISEKHSVLNLNRHQQIKVWQIDFDAE